MPERTRNILTRLRQYIGERRRAERREVSLPVAVSLKDDRAVIGSRRQESLEGHTLDISTSGLALILPAIRIGGHYLAGENHPLVIKLELPEGLIEVQAISVRYERLDENESEMGYLIGLRIIELSAADRVRYEDYIRSLSKR